MDLEHLKAIAHDWRFYNEARRDPFPARDLADNIDWAVAKIESDAKVIAALRAAFLRHVQFDNNDHCNATGLPCREAAKCGCALEMQTAIDEILERNEQTVEKSNG